MRLAGDPSASINSTALIAAAKRRASEKLNLSNGLHHKLREDTGPDPRRPGGRRKNDVCRSGTDQVVPFRYGPDAPRLDAAFVAQLLGQMMSGREQDHASVLTAYEEPSLSARVFDTRL
jgi:hypothetical protein